MAADVGVGEVDEAPAVLPRGHRAHQAAEVFDRLRFHARVGRHADPESDELGIDLIGHSARFVGPAQGTTQLAKLGCQQGRTRIATGRFDQGSDGLVIESVDQGSRSDRGDRFFRVAVEAGNRR